MLDNAKMLANQEGKHAVQSPSHTKPGAHTIAALPPRAPRALIQGLLGEEVPRKKQAAPCSLTSPLGCEGQPKCMKSILTACRADSQG